LHVERVRVDESAEDFLREYRINNRKSLDDAEARWNLHLKPSFAAIRAVDVSSGLIGKYVDKRQQEGAANATINRELAGLKRMFRLAQQATPSKVLRTPAFPKLTENNARMGFLTDAQRDALAKECAMVGLWLRTMFEVGCTYG
jgi:site-specific recombinase XerD